MTEHQTRAERARMPLAREVVRAAAIENGVCIRPVSVRKVDRVTGAAELVDLPCGATLAGKCPSCAERARRLRIAQCREGWHLDAEPIQEAEPATAEQRTLATARADLERVRVDTEDAGEDLSEVDQVIDQVDELVAESGVRGRIGAGAAPRRVRSTRRRRDVADLPRRRVDARTVGRVYGERFRPSLFVTATLDSYGPVRPDGTPVDPDRYDYVRAARDAVHFGRLVDRFVQNLRRFVGWDVQYFAAVEPQRRLAPHLHLATRGTVSRVELRQVAAATYHQVWWPQCDQVVYDTVLPVWDQVKETYVDPETGGPLLRAVLHTAVDDDVIRRNPCRIKGADQEHAAERPTLNPDQVAALARSMPPRLVALVMLATYASLRWGELAALRRADLDLAGATVRVERTQVEVGGRVTEGPTKSRAGRRVVAFPPTLVPLLRRHLADYVGEEPTALVFTGPKGARLRRNNFGKLAGWSAAVTAVGAPGLHFHDLRHTGNAFAAKIPGTTIRDLMGRMGHDSTRAAMIYLHGSPGADRAIADALPVELNDAVDRKDGPDDAAR